MHRHTQTGLKWALGLGAGIGLMAGAFGAALLPRPGLTDDQVRERARVLGMVLATSLPPAPTLAPAPAPAAKEAPPKAVVPVVEGMSFGQIAAMLKQLGVVSDEQALIARAREREALEQVKAGVYTITLDPARPVTPDQVIDQLLKGSS